MKVSGFVESFVTIQPKSVKLQGKAGEPLKSIVKIIPRVDYPFKISDIRYRNGKYIKAEIKEETVDHHVQYILTVNNLKTDAGRYFDRINLKTDSKIQPIISIRVLGDLT